MPGIPSIRVTWLRSTLLRHHWAVPPGSHLLRQRSIYRLVPKAPLFIEITTALKAFLKPQDISGQRPYAWFPPFKGLVLHFGMKYRSNNDFNNSLAGILLIQSDSVLVLSKTVVLRIVTIFRLSYFPFNVNFDWNEILILF